jgi:putative membrane protein
VKPITILTVSVASLALVACGRKDSADTPAAELNTMVNEDVALGNDAANAPTLAPTTTQGFANAAAASDHFEIESSKLAIASGSSAAVKTFANNMIKAHTASSAELKILLSGLPTPITPNDAFNPDQQRMLDGLQGKTGAELDTAYAAAQVAAHQATLDTLKAYSSGGDTPGLKQFADKMIPTVTAHLNTAKGLK